MDNAAPLKTELERLQLREKEIEKLLSVTSHNLREPLRHVLSYTQLLQYELAADIKPEAAEFLRQIHQSARRLEAIIDGLSAISSLDSREANIRPLDLKRVIDEARLQLAKPVKAAGARIRLEGSFPAVLGDSAILADAVQHLLDNALKFRGEAAPEIEIRAGEEDGQVSVSIADNGIGVKEQYREKCFGLFKRLHSQAEYPGEGIGLAYARKAIEKLGGRVWLDGPEEQGITVRFTLPSAG